MFSSLIFITGAHIVARRNIETTATKRSADPIIGHVEQYGMPGEVSILYIQDIFY